MRTPLNWLAPAVCLTLGATGLSARSLISEDWKFVRFESVATELASLECVSADDGSWRDLDLPHDWGIEGPFMAELPNRTGKLPWHGIGWYRKYFEGPELSAGERLLIEFEGAMSHPKVWLNGQLVGEWAYGYSSFILDLTGALIPGQENVLAVRLDNPPESSRWYPGGGLYRDVWLIRKPAVAVEEWSTFITTPEISAESAQVSISTTIQNNFAEGVEARVRHVLLGPDQREVAVAEGKPVQISSGDAAEVAALTEVQTPTLWDIDSPLMHTCRTEVWVNDKLVDQEESRFGIRSIEWKVDEGFLLNGRVVEIQGVCQHHDLGALGGAFNRRAAERQLEILREMGCNAIRISHNPPAPALLDLCDEMGLLVMDELFDSWGIAKTEGDYASDFDAWHERDVRNWIYRDRNHPSVIAWSLGNEVVEQHMRGDSRARTERLIFLAKQADPTRAITAGKSKEFTMFNGFTELFDIAGYNYKAVGAKTPNYATHMERHPTLPVYGAETSSCVSSRGEYFFPMSEDQESGFYDFQVSSYDWYGPQWGYRPDIEFDSLDRFPALAGEFVWTGFDYLGEPTPYNRDQTNALNVSDPEEQAALLAELERLGSGAPSRSSYFGIIDLAGFPKDRYYLYQSRWRPDFPMAHILPHWNWEGREGERTPVHVYTNGDEAELLLNGESLGRKSKGPRDYRLIWPDVDYQPGKLEVVVYRNGQPWSRAVRETSGVPAQFRVTADRSSLKAGGLDLAFVSIDVLDAEGRTVPDANVLVNFEVEGAGEFVAADNGDATDWTTFSDPSRKTFNGRALAILRGIKGESGSAVLRVSSEGLEPAEVTVEFNP